MVRIGKIVATHGLNGAVILTHIVGKSAWLKKDNALYIEMQKGSYIPHFVAACKASSPEEYIVNIEEINKVESAKKLVNKHVYVDEALLSGHAKNSPLLWIGFKLIDKEKGEIGTVEDVIQTGSQWLAKLTYQNTEVLIPLVEQTVDNVDIKKKTINVTMPEGLLEIYLK